MDDCEERIAKLLDALERITTFGHTEGCNCQCAPVYECGCYEEDQADIARKALEEYGYE